jgi:hypothetical protein
MDSWIRLKSRESRMKEIKDWSSFNWSVAFKYAYIWLEVVVIGSGSIEYIDCYNIKWYKKF